MKGDSWGVVATVRAPASMINFFVQHYLNLGAHEVFIYLDDINYNSASEIYPHEKLVIVDCDDDYWSLQGGKPVGIEKKQCLNYAHARKAMFSSWSIHVDIDELICSPFSIGLLLNALPGRFFSIQVRPLEAIYTSLIEQSEVYSAKYFKLQTMDKKFLNDLFGAEWVSLGKRGFFAHDKGKSFVRTNHDIDGWYIHTPSPKNKGLLRSLEVRGVELLHFECQDPQSFIEKIKRRLNGATVTQRLSPTGQRKLEMFRGIYQQKGDEGLIDVYKQLNVFSSDRLRRGIEKGFFVERSLANDEHEAELNFLPILVDWQKRSLMYVEKDRKLVFSHDEIGQVVRLALFDEKMVLYIERNGKLVHLKGRQEIRLSVGDSTLDADSIYKVERKGRVKFLIRSGRNYFKANRDGEFVVGGPVAKKWEVFRAMQENNN